MFEFATLAQAKAECLANCRKVSFLAGGTYLVRQADGSLAEVELRYDRSTDRITVA